MDYLPVLKLLSLLLLLDLGSAARKKESKKYDQIQNGIDWRQYGYISPVQDQGDCEVSWALSAVAAMEAHLAIKNRHLVEFSAQQVIDCSQQPKFKCFGGSSSVAFDYMQNNGITSKTSYPFRAEQSTCSYDRITNGTKIKSYVSIHDYDEKSLAEFVYNIGPLVVRIDFPCTFKGYKSGIYSATEFNYNMYYIASYALIVGFGTDSNNVDYWILKGSLGPNWGENGYMRLARNAGNMCGVATLAQYPFFEE